MAYNLDKKVKYSIKKYTKTPHTANLPVRKFKLKVGHAGTLDPLATGLLIVCTGKETKNIEAYQAKAIDRQNKIDARYEMISFLKDQKGRLSEANRMLPDIKAADQLLNELKQICNNI